MRELTLSSRQSQRTMPSDDPGPPRRDVRVLIVDDSGPFRVAARELLVRRGYLVIGEASSTGEAIEAIDNQPPDAVLLDVRLRDESGSVVAAYLRARYPGSGGPARIRRRRRRQVPLGWGQRSARPGLCRSPTWRSLTSPITGRRRPVATADQRPLRQPGRDPDERPCASPAATADQRPRPAKAPPRSGVSARSEDLCLLRGELIVVEHALLVKLSELAQALGGFAGDEPAARASRSAPGCTHPAGPGRRPAPVVPPAGAGCACPWRRRRLRQRQHVAGVDVVKVACRPPTVPRRAPNQAQP